MKTLQEYYEEGQFTAFGDLMIFPNGRILVETPFGFLFLSNDDCGKILSKVALQNFNFEGMYTVGDITFRVDNNNHATAFIDNRSIIRAAF